MFLLTGEESPFVEEAPLAAFLNAAFVGRPSVLNKPENSEVPFRNAFQRGDMGG